MGEELSGKVAIVTGGASGIGRATVEMFVQEGAKVVIADLNKDWGEALASQLGDAATFKHTDVSDADQVQSLVDFTVDRFGGLHVMFNNAGISSQTAHRFLDDEFKDFQRVLGVNLYGVLIGSQRAARHMAKNGGGSIINTTSIAGTLPGFAFLVYRSSKAAVLQMSKSIAIDLAEYNVRVNCIAPGHIRTEMTSFADPSLSPEDVERIEKVMAPVWSKNQPLKRRGRPQDIANAALYLASDRSAQVTGIQLLVDGGVTAGDPVNHIEELTNARATALVG